MGRVLAAILCGAMLLGACSGTPSSTSSSSSGLVSSTTSTSAHGSQPTTTSPNAGTTTTTDDIASGGVDIDGKIGVVGCSNTTGAVEGYTALSTLDLLTEGGLTGGSLAVWGNPRPARHDRYWGLYDERRPVDGYAGTWVQLCIRTTEHQGAFDETEQVWIEHVVDEIRKRDGDIPIWISGVNSFADGVLCESIGPDGAAIAAEAADWAAANIAGVQRGPDLGPLEEQDRDSAGDCHPNASGQEKLGLQLVAFFDGD